MNILIVEDDFVSRKILFEILTEFGTCDMVVDGVEAVEAFKLAWKDGTPYDLVFLDIMMPNMDGQEALRLIRRFERQQGVRGSAEAKIIMLTALGDPGSVVEAFYKGGATSYMVKPIERDKLVKELVNLGLLAQNAG